MGCIFSQKDNNVSINDVKLCVWKKKLGIKRVTFYAGVPGQFRYEEAINEEDIPTGSEEQWTDQSNSEDSSDVFLGLAAEDDFIRLPRDLWKVWRTQNFHRKYGKTCIPQSPFHPLVLLSASRPRRRWRHSWARYHQTDEDQVSGPTLSWRHWRLKLWDRRWETETR